MTNEKKGGMSEQMEGGMKKEKQTDLARDRKVHRDVRLTDRQTE